MDLFLFVCDRSFVNLWNLFNKNGMRGLDPCDLSSDCSHCDVCARPFGSAWWWWWCHWFCFCPDEGSMKRKISIHHWIFVFLKTLIFPIASQSLSWLTTSDKNTHTYKKRTNTHTHTLEAYVFAMTFDMNVNNCTTVIDRSQSDGRLVFCSWIFSSSC